MTKLVYPVTYDAVTQEHRSGMYSSPVWHSDSGGYMHTYVVGPNEGDTSLHDAILSAFAYRRGVELIRIILPPGKLIEGKPTFINQSSDSSTTPRGVPRVEIVGSAWYDAEHSVTDLVGTGDGLIYNNGADVTLHNLKITSPTPTYKDGVAIRVKGAALCTLHNVHFDGYATAIECENSSVATAGVTTMSSTGGAFTPAIALSGSTARLEGIINYADKGAENNDGILRADSQSHVSIASCTYANSQNARGIAYKLTKGSTLYLGGPGQKPPPGSKAGTKDASSNIR